MGIEKKNSSFLPCFCRFLLSFLPIFCHCFCSIFRHTWSTTNTINLHCKKKFRKFAATAYICFQRNDLSAIEDKMKNFCENVPVADTRSMQSLRENLHLPLTENGSQCDSGISSGQTEPSIMDPLSPAYVSPMKKRNRGSDSSEEEWFHGRQKGRFTRTRPISKVFTFLCELFSLGLINWLQSCRAIYDEVGVGDAVAAMKILYQKVSEQKQLIMASLENDCSKEEINVQICVSNF